MRKSGDGKNDQGDRMPVGFRIRLARHSGIFVSLFEFFLRGAILWREALPIGLLRRQDIAQVVNAAYSSAPDFYNPTHYPIRYESDLIPRLTALGCGTEMLDLYCGQGREAEIFARAGYNVTGVDTQSESIHRAQRYAESAGFAAKFVAADIETWDPPMTEWDVIYSSLWMYSTIPDRAVRINWLRRISRWLATDGVLVISTTPKPSIRRAMLRHWIAKVVARISFNSRHPEPGDRFHDGLFWHDFAKQDVVIELQEANLQIVDELIISGGTPCEFYILRPFSD